MPMTTKISKKFLIYYTNINAKFQIENLRHKDRKQETLIFKGTGVTNVTAATVDN